MNSFYGFIGSIQSEIEEKEAKDARKPIQRSRTNMLNESKKKECIRCEAEMDKGQNICSDCGYMQDSKKKEKK